MSNVSYFRSRVYKDTFKNAPYSYAMRDVSKDVYFMTAEEKGLQKELMQQKKEDFLSRLHRTFANKE